uniref:Uncharacterized protein n=1 Tax=Nelumbo nucifera TaxID=4432 RepID=A0A822YI06_NELNU|nr:TPA_asm: hypothetical protein HUJ06_012675 [Nelumbo nucifera]
MLLTQPRVNPPISLSFKFYFFSKYLVLEELFSFRPYYNIGLVGVRMYVAVNLKRYQKVKEVGKITMNVRVIACYQLMQVCQAEYFRQLLKPVT